MEADNEFNWVINRRPGAGEVRLDVAYCGLCGTDLHIARGAMDSRVQPPQVIGHEMSGTIAEVGEGDYVHGSVLPVDGGWLAR